MADLKINNIELRKNLSTKWDNIGDIGMGRPDQYVVIGPDGKPTWATGQYWILPSHDAYTLSYAPDTKFNNTGLIIAYYDIVPIVQFRTFLSFPLGSIPTSDISSAFLMLFQISPESAGQVYEHKIYKNITTFDEGTLTWNNQPEADGDEVAILKTAIKPLVQIKCDLTLLVKGWLTGAISNNGIQIQSADTTALLKEIAFASKDIATADIYYDKIDIRPRLLVTTN
jgi:hypothetical protein